MLPPGHIAAGFLTAKALLHFTGQGLTQTQQNHLLWWGIFFSFAPDLDSFISFAKEKSFAVRNPAKNNHRKFVSHVPILWAIAGFLIFFLSRTQYFKVFGLILWLCSWSHFILDSIEYGIMWLWPFNKEKWALKDRGIDKPIVGKTFTEYWLNFLKFYITRWTFYAEIIVLISVLFFIKR
jgi:membrane-bound metal-dependent hydrolase YbcI (DUF457 family)